MSLYRLRMNGLLSLSLEGWLVSTMMSGMKGDQVVCIVEDCFLHEAWWIKVI